MFGMYREILFFRFITPEHFIPRRKSQNFSLNYWENNIELASGLFASTRKIFYGTFTIFCKFHRKRICDRTLCRVQRSERGIRCK